VDPRDAAGEPVAGVEERGVGVGELRPHGEEVVRGLAAGLHAAMGTAEQRDRLVRPDRPLPEETAHEAHRPFAGPAREGRDQVGHDRVVVPRVERDVVASAHGQGARHVEGRVAVERRHLDRHHRGDLEESAPEGLVQDAPSDRRLQIEAEEGDHLADPPAVGDQLVVACFAQGGQAQEADVVAEPARELRFREGLGRRPADARHRDRLRAPRLFAVAQDVHGQGEHRLEETYLRIADRELRGVHGHRHPARSRVAVVAGERELPALVELAIGGEG
jgi:hypothetical protein